MKTKIFCVLAAASLLLAGCDDLLDKDPRDTFLNNKAFWSNENQVEGYSNAFYGFYGSASSFYFNSLNDDQVNPSFDNWTYTTVPNKSGVWSGMFTNIRQINYMLDGLKISTLPNATKVRYEAIGRLNRAWEYYQLVQMYGDVQWEDHVIDNLESEEVYGPRTDRDLVMDKVLEDLNFAIANIPSNTSDKTEWSKEFAEAMKSDVCLYEGTFCKYRTLAENGKAPDLTRANRYLQACVDASESLRTSGKFTLNVWTPDAKGKIYTIYNSLDLSSNDEVIFTGISTTDKPEEITVPEKPRYVSYSFRIDNKDEKTIDDRGVFYIHTDVLLKDNNTELELCLFFDEWDNQRNQRYHTFFTVPLAQYTLLPKFLYALYEYWTFNSNTYYEIIEKKSEANGYPHTWKERKPRKKEIAKIFTETARNIFGKDAKTESLTLTPQAFKERMEALEYPEWQIGSSYSEIIRVNDIPQLVLSTGIDAVHIQLAITLNASLTELEVYLDEKTDPDGKGKRDEDR